MARLAQRRAAARIASKEAMRAAGMDEQDVANKLAEVGQGQSDRSAAGLSCTCTCTC